MSKLTQRQEQILAAIVRDYSQTGNPVGSEELVSKYHFVISSATIRNEMKALEQAGMITQPHTSAGRVPTDQGYRYFVNKLMNHLELTAVEQKRLRQELSRLQHQYLEMGRSISKLLSSQTHGAAFALLPEGVASSGLSQVIDQETNPRELREVARFFDELDTHGHELSQKDIRAVTTYIGKDCPIPLASDFSLMVNRVDLPDGRKGVIGIVGPKRMKYARNISLLEYISKLLSAGLGVFIIISNFPAWPAGSNF